MTKRWLVSLAGGLVVLSASAGSLGAGGAQQQPTAPSPLSASPQRAIINQYCVGCHNDRVRTAGLALDTIDLAARGRARGGVGKGRAEASRPHDAPARAPAAGRSHVRLARVISGDVARPVGRRHSQSWPDRHVPPAQSNRIPECDPRPARARRRRVVAAPERRCEPWLRQCGCRRALADAVGAIPGGGAEGQPSGGRESSALAREPHRRAAGGPHAGGSVRRSAVRHARRNGRPPHLPARRHLRDPDSLVARPQRKRRRTHRTAPAGADAGWHARRSSSPSHRTGTSGRRLLRGRSGRQGFERPCSGAGRSARAWRHVPAKDICAAGNGASAVPGALQHGPASTNPAGRVFGLDHRAVRRGRGRRHAEPPPDLRVPSRQRAAEEAGCARTILSTLARRAYRRPVTDADLQAPLTFYRDARAEGGFDAGIEMALRAILASTEFLFRIERDPRERCAEYGLSRQRSGAGVSPVFLPVEQHPGRGTARPGHRRDTEAAGGAGTAGPADAGRPALGGAGHELCRAVAVPAQPGRRESGHPDVPGLRRQPAAGLPAGNGAVLREHREGRPQRARPAAGATTRSSTNGWPGTTAFPTCTAAASGASRSARTACAEGCSVRAAF